ncbi:hypothetical protein BC830DRAFT_775702 [Chytriomyces sp. MP71]|nr:hypothetical protein BC830DRAFT_775702 [Chytriomyces sp. MP71]
MYGKFATRRKKRSDPVLELIPLPNILVQHNGSSLNMLPSSIRFWEKLGLEPTGGAKEVGFLTVCPAGSKSFLQNLKRWGAESSNMWDFASLGTLWPVSDCRLGDDDGIVQAKLRLVKGVSRDDSRIRAYAETMDALVPELARMLHQRLSNSTASYVSLFLLNPFPHKPQSKHELNILAARLLLNTARASNLPLQTVIESIIPVVVPIHFALIPRLTEARCLFDLKEFLFGLYSRCRDRQTRLTGRDDGVSLGFTSHAYTLAKTTPPGLGITLYRPLDEPLCTTSDPDRLMHIVYHVSATGKQLGVVWTDSIGEIVDVCAVSVATGTANWFLRCLAEVWERTVALLGLRRMPLGVNWRLVFAKEGIVSNVELQDFERFLDYMSTSTNMNHVMKRVTSITFVSFNSDSVLSVVDSGAVAGQAGGGSSQSFLVVPSEVAGGDKKTLQTDSDRLKSGSDERIIFDGSAAYMFLMRSQRLPIGTQYLKVRNAESVGGAPMLSVYTAGLEGEELDSVGSFLPLAGGYLLDVPRRESIAMYGQSGQSPPAANLASKQTTPPLTPPVGSQAVQSIEASLLFHCTLNQHAKSTCYPGWTAQSDGSAGAGQPSYSSPTTSSSNSTPGAISNTNTPVLVHSSMTKSPGMNPMTPQPSTPFSSGAAVGSSIGNAPQHFHCTVLRDVMREFYALRFVHRGPSFGVVGVRREIPWVFEMAGISAACGGSFAHFL